MGPAEATSALRKPSKVAVNDSRYTSDSDTLLRCREMSRWANRDTIAPQKNTAPFAF
jgi:hypothetical protein